MNYPFCVVGLDIGGTKIAGGIVKYEKPNVEPEVSCFYKQASQAHKGIKIFLANILDTIDVIVDNAKDNNVINDNCKLIAVGMGSPGRCNKNTGIIETETDNFPGYAGTPLTKIVSEHVGVPAFVLNDVQSHTLGEARWGASKGTKNSVLLAIGTGIGGAVIVDGKLMLGKHGFAGELGHVPCPHAKGYPCSCGLDNHLEGVAAGCGIERVYKSRTGKSLTGPEITKKAYEGDEDAIFCLDLSGAAIGRAIGSYLNVFDPDVIILTGSVVNAGKIWRDALNRGIKEEVIPEIIDNLNLSPAKLGDMAPMVGAAEYALDNLGFN